MISVNELVYDKYALAKEVIRKSCYGVNLKLQNICNVGLKLLQNPLIQSNLLVQWEILFYIVVKDEKDLFEALKI